MAKLSDIEPLVSDGRIFSVWFIKRTNDEDRFMVARTGVRQGTKGIGLSFDPRKRNLLGPVWDMKKRAYRFISCERVEQLRHHGKVVEFVFEDDKWTEPAFEHAA